MRPTSPLTLVLLGCLATLPTLVLGCGPSTGSAPGALSANDVAAAKTRWPDTSEAALEKGHQTFLASCNRCHGYPLLTSESASDWPGIVKEMGEKAKLDQASSDEVLRYILAAREAHVQSK